MINRYNKASLLACLIFYSSVGATKILKDDHYTSGRNTYSWKNACSFLTKRSSPLIEYHSADMLDCMGEKKKVMPFCEEKEITNPYLTRAIVDRKNKTIQCVSGKRVILKWKCEGENDKYCKDQEVGCFLFKEKLAKKLKLIHHSLTDSKTVLNCYFDIQKNNLNLNI